MNIKSMLGTLLFSLKMSRLYKISVNYIHSCAFCVNKLVLRNSYVMSSLVANFTVLFLLSIHFCFFPVFVPIIIH